MAPPVTWRPGCCNHRGVENSTHRPSARIRLIGQAICRLVALLPASWPIVRPAIERYFDSAAASWDSRTGAGGFEHLETLSVALDSVRVKPERVLDIGCGTGQTTLFLAREYPHARVRGVDLSPEMIHRAGRRLGLDPSARVSFRVADAARLPWSDQAFDLVVQVNVPVFAREIARVLRPAGEYLAISTLGSGTPFFTPSHIFVRAVERAGMIPAGEGLAGSGSWQLARVPDDG